MANPERLQKILAEGGFGSRRECETLILEGRVEVDRVVVQQLGTKVDPENQSIRVDGQKFKPAFKKYYAVNKPRGVVSTSKDPSGRPRVIDLIPTDQRVYTVGRLDKDSEGLIIVTNDGSLAHRLTHPRFGIEKTYLIQVEGHPTREQMDSLVEGVHLADGFVQIKSYQFKRKQKHTTEIEVVLDEGRNREVRRLLARIGHKVLFLRRIAVGSYGLDDLPFGHHKQLDHQDVESLTINPKRRSAKSKNKKPSKKKPAGDSPRRKKKTSSSSDRAGASPRAAGKKSTRKKAASKKPFKGKGLKRKSDSKRKPGETKSTPRRKKRPTKKSATTKPVRRSKRK